MIREKFIFLSIILILVASNYLVKCENEGFFTVVGRNLLKFQQPYRVAITHQGYKEDKVLQIGIREIIKNLNGYEVYKNVTIRGDGIRNINFDVSIDKISTILINYRQHS